MPDFSPRGRAISSLPLPGPSEPAAQARDGTEVGDRRDWPKRLVRQRKIRDKIKADGKGTPGWDFKCTVGGIIKVTDECTGETSMKMENGETGVIASFDATSRENPDNCSVGGAKEGLLFGSADIEDSESEKILALADE